MSKGERHPAGAAGLAAVLGIDIGGLVPERYAAYRPLIADALGFFLERLPQARFAAIVAAQLALPIQAGVAQRLVALLQQCPSLHKLGQVVARDRRLAPELRERLQTLETLPATTSMHEILPVLRRELGARLDELAIGATPLAQASVAVVVPFTRHASGAKRVDGVFKVLRPGIEARLREELALWPALGDLLAQRGAELGLPPLDYRDALDSVAELLLHEMRPEQEQAHLAAAARRYAGMPGVHVPALLPWCTPHITAMERVDGVKVTQVEGLSPGRRRELADTLLEALLARPFWSDAHAALFHADPHAGNLLLTQDGRLAILDWGLITTLGKAQREAIVRLVLAGATQDEAGVCTALAGLGHGAHVTALREAVAAALRELRQGSLPGFAWTQRLLDRLAGSGTLRFGHGLLLFRKAVLTLTAVAHDVAPDCSPDAVLLGTAFARFVGEAPARAGAAFDSRAFGSHVSNADLLALWLDAPVAAARYWQGLWLDGWTRWCVRQESGFGI